MDLSDLVVMKAFIYIVQLKSNIIVTWQVECCMHVNYLPMLSMFFKN